MIRNSPSKKVYVVAFVAIGVLVWVVVTETIQTYPNTTQSIVTAVGAYSISLDTDRDGLPDWEEKLFGTNPLDPDTNNDGISDGVALVSKKAIYPLEVSDSVFNYISDVRQAVFGGNDSIKLPDAQLRIVPDRYTQDVINTTETSERSSLDYFADVLFVLKEYADSLDADIFTIIVHWLQTKDVEDLDALAKISTDLENASVQLSLITVPDALVLTHLKLTNSFYAESSVLREIEVTNHSPVDGFLVSAAYANYQGKRAYAFLELAEYFNNEIPYAIGKDE